MGATNAFGMPLQSFACSLAPDAIARDHAATAPPPDVDEEEYSMTITLTLKAPDEATLDLWAEILRDSFGAAT